MTPDQDNIAFKSTQPSLTESNKKANARANKLLASGNFNF
jgi:hypothetical protein